jgi:hypothetical protein
MDIDIIFSESAFGHGFGEKSIRHAMDYFIYEEPFEEDDNKILVVGFSESGILLEIMYNVLNENSVRVFHAMECRAHLKKFIEEETLWQI